MEETTNPVVANVDGVREPADVKKASKKKAGRPRKYATDQEAYDANRAAARKASARISLHGRELKELPKVADQARKDRCRESLLEFLRTYLSKFFPLPFSDDHLEVIAIIEESIKSGGKLCTSMPRASGKSTIATGAIVWAICYGWRKFPVVCAATKKAALEFIELVMEIFEDNDLIHADFPEITAPIRATKSSHNKAKGQLYKGVPTRIKWNPKKVVSFPRIEGSAASAVGLAAFGLNSTDTRGLKKPGAGGTIARPDFVLIDDPTDDRNAKLKTQNDRREKVINSGLARMCGPNSNMAMMMTCTVIEPDDVAARFLDRDRNPDWRGHKYGILRSLPTERALKFWSKYKELRDESLKSHGTIELATAFYLANQLKMSEGALVSWQHRIEPPHPDALCTAMDVYVSEPNVFWCELMNEPMRNTKSALVELDEKTIFRRLMPLPRGVVPDWANKVIASIDIQGKSLWWLIVAFDSNMKGHICDFGTFPDQKVPYWTNSQIRVSLQEATGQPTKELAFEVGLRTLCSNLLDLQLPSQTGTKRTVDLIVIDANWDESTNIVYTLARTLGRGKIVPIHGRKRSSRQSSIDQFKCERGARRGPGWLSERGSRQQLHLIADGNYLKTWLHSQLTSEANLMTVFEESVETLGILVDNLCAEYGKPMKDLTTGRVVTEWFLRVGRDNHFFDDLVYATVGASFLGGLLPGQVRKPVIKRPAFRQSEDLEW